MAVVTAALAAPRTQLGSALRRHPGARRSIATSVLIALLGLLAAIAPSLPESL